MEKSIQYIIFLALFNFSADDGVHQSELWKSDGTAEGTIMVKDINPDNVGGDGSSPGMFTGWAGHVFFTANDGIHGTEIWKTDGTADRTTMVKDLTSNNLFVPYNLIMISEKLYFLGNDGHGYQIWKSDGTDGGTTMLSNFNYEDSYINRPTNFTNLFNVLYFSADDGIYGNELWKSDGTVEGTTLVKNINPETLGSSPAQLTNANGMLYFTANDGVHGPEIWKTDGLPGGITSLVKDMAEGDFNLYGILGSINGAVYFNYSNGLWKTDGSDAGTIKLKSFYGFENNLTLIIGETLYFYAYDVNGNNELWKSDGTPDGTIMVKDIHPLGQGFGSNSNGGNATNVAGTMYFTADDGLHGIELWKSNGTEAGTVLVKDIKTGASGSGPFELTNVNGILYFVADDGEHGTELWKSDGTTGGTVMIKDIVPPNTLEGNPTHLTDIAGILYFSAYDSDHGYELWKSDGTANGTVMVKDIKPSKDFATDLRNFCNVSGTLFFTANDSIHGYELWKSDGTANGTVLVKDIQPGVVGAFPGELISLGGKLFFTADDGIHGSELWKSDGTSNGTLMIEEINPGLGGETVGNLTISGTDLFFIGDDGIHGKEIWKYVTDMADISSSVELSNYCAGSSISVTYSVSGGTPATGNTFTAQLSNATGSFSKPINIGTLHSIALSGTIHSILPLSEEIDLGSGYKIRVVCDRLASNYQDNGVNITINSLPKIFVNRDQFICTSGGTPATLFAYGSGALTCTWLPETGLNSTSGFQVIASPTTTTSYTATTTSEAGCVTKHEATIHLVSSITANAGEDKTACPNQTLYLTGRGGLTYSWAPALGLSNTNGYHTDLRLNNLVGVYSYSLTAMNGFCVATDEVRITVFPRPTITILGNLSICPGNSTVLTAVGADSYLWTPSNIASSTISTSSAGTIQVTGNDANCPNSSMVNVLTKPLPTIVINGGTTVCAGQSITLTANGASQYIWSTGINAPSLTVSPTGNSSYTVTGTGSNDCSSIKTTSIEVVNCTNGIMENSLNKSFMAFPNPTNGHLRVSFGINDPGDFVIRIRDIMGKELFEEVRKNFTGQYEHDFDLGGLNKGMYFVQLIVKNETFGLKVILE